MPILCNFALLYGAVCRAENVQADRRPDYEASPCRDNRLGNAPLSIQK